jgi:hypothetical protein
MFQTSAETSSKFFDSLFLLLRGRHGISYQAFVGDDLLVDIPTHFLPGDFDLREDCSQQAFCDMIQKKTLYVILCGSSFLTPGAPVVTPKSVRAVPSAPL